MSIKLVLFVSILFVLSASVLVAEEPPYYRVWRGWRLNSLTKKEFIGQLENSFIPATPGIMADKGLVSYHVALPYKAKYDNAVFSYLPDEIALVSYQSKDVFRRAFKEHQSARDYAAMHWEVFDRERSFSARKVLTFSGGERLLCEVAYDLCNRPVDWQSHASNTGFFLGVRKTEIEEKLFMERLRFLFKRIQSKSAINGCVALIGKMEDKADYLMAFYNYSKTSALKDPFRVAASLMDTVIFKQAEDFSGRLEFNNEDGVVYSVPFERK